MLAVALPFVFLAGMWVGEWLGGFRVRKTASDPKSMPYTTKILVDHGWKPPE